MSPNIWLFIRSLELYERSAPAKGPDTRSTVPFPSAPSQAKQCPVHPASPSDLR
jgi:hypothetical protein